MSFIVHPDYVKHPRQLLLYKELLAHLNRLRRENDVWITTPFEVNRWWRQRAGMRLVEIDGSWRIEGEGSERASIGYAKQEDGRLVLSIDASSLPQSRSTNAATPAEARG
jgi:hypothetical protein